MVIVAVAGGSGGLGRTLVEANVATGEHEVKCSLESPSLTENQANHAVENELGDSVLVVDYTNQESLGKTLRDNNIHTVVSAVNMLHGDGLTSPESALIRAADASGSTKRFIANETKMQAVLNNNLSRAELQHTTNLEYTSVHNGMFLDFWGLPLVESHMTPYTTVIDLEHDAAGIPESGDVPFVFMHTADVARYVAALLHLRSWDGIDIFPFAGDRVTWNQFLALVESVKVLSDRKFKVAYDNEATLEAGQATVLPGHASALEYLSKELLQKINSAFGLWFTRGTFTLEPKNALNDMFPNIHPMKVKDILTAAWGRV